jgi:CubicO group peptidase (beta-lactamase class C family)
MRPNLQISCLLFFLLFQATDLASAQDFDKVKMDSLFSLIEVNQKGMGSVSIFKDGVEVYQNSIGFGDVQNGILAHSTTTYRIGSISKSFTATLIMQLIEEKKLTLDTKLADFFPGVAHSKEISIEQLLRHESGIFNFTSAPEYQEWMEKPKTRAELLQIIKDGGTVFEPGERMEYSNSNYVLLSLIIEEIEKSSFSEVLTDRIVEPLQLTRTYYGDKINTEKNEALSYTRGEAWILATETDMSVPLGAGALVSTPTDLNRFFTALFGGELVSESSLDAMCNLTNNVGLGLFQVPFYEKRALGHNGGIDGFQSTSGYYREEGVCFSYTTNGVVFPMNNIVIGILSIYFGKDYDLPEFTPSLILKSEELDKYLGVYGATGFPVKITITKLGNALVGQASGQASFPLEAYEKDKFRFDQAGLTMEFLPGDRLVIFRQGGQEFELTRED